MRVSNLQVVSNLNSEMASANSSMQNLTQELATGLSISEPSDNPSGTAQAMALQSTLGNVQQYLTNITSASSFLSASDSALSSLSSLLTQADQIAVGAANGGTDDTSTLASYATEIQSIITQVTNIANSDFNGTKLFSGQQTSTDAYTPGDTTYAYQGNDGAINTAIGAGQSMQINVPGDQVFGPVLAALQSLDTDLTTGNTTNIANSDISGIQAASNTVSQTRAVIGTKLDQLTSTTTQLQDAQVNYQTQLSGLEDISLPTVYADFQQAQNVYQASLVATTQAMKLSLADYLQ